MEQLFNAGTGDFILKLLGAFGALTALIIGILAWNKDRFKMTIENDSVKRKEVAELLKELYDDLKTENEAMKKEHSSQIIRLLEIIEKKDGIIREIISYLPIEKREEISERVRELDHDIKSVKQVIQSSNDTPSTS